jgi:hypothetical protein
MAAGRFEYRDPSLGNRHALSVDPRVAVTRHIVLGTPHDSGHF